MLDLYSANLTSHHSTLVVRNFCGLHVYKVPASPPSFLVLAHLYAVVDSCGARLHKTQHSHLPMDPLDNVNHSLYYNSSTTPDEVRKVYEEFTIMLPPGAVPTYSPTPSLHPQVESELPFLPPTGHYPDTNRVHTPFSTDSLSDGSEMSPYDPSTSAHDSTSPTPRAPHPHNSRRNVPRKSQFPWLVPRLR